MSEREFHYFQKIENEGPLDPCQFTIQKVNREALNLETDFIMFISFLIFLITLSSTNKSFTSSHQWMNECTFVVVDSTVALSYHKRVWENFKTLKTAFHLLAGVFSIESSSHIHPCFSLSTLFLSVFRKRFSKGTFIFMMNIKQISRLKNLLNAGEGRWERLLFAVEYHANHFQVKNIITMNKGEFFDLVCFPIHSLTWNLMTRFQNLLQVNK